MKKLLSIIFLVVFSVVSMNAQALFYVQAGADPKESSVIVFVFHNNTLVQICGGDTGIEYMWHNGTVRSKIMEDPNYFEALGSKLVGRSYETLAGYSNCNLDFLRSNNGYHYYRQKRGTFVGSPLGGNRLFYTYHAFSADWQTYVENPNASPLYWTRVDKSNFELSF